jgi:hypothetical protein
MSGIERNETTFFHADKNNATKESVISTEAAHGATVRCAVERPLYVPVALA